VEKSQEYLVNELGEDWQEEYYIWDCAAGTGNLLAGLTNRHNIWASTLEQADVDTMKERIVNGADLFANHVFQFDFLNDPLLDKTTTDGRVVKSKVPDGLQKIIANPEMRKDWLSILILPMRKVITEVEKVEAVWLPIPMWQNNMERQWAMQSVNSIFNS